jgi:hypothetical protein
LQTSLLLSEAFERSPSTHFSNVDRVDFYKGFGPQSD